MSAEKKIDNQQVLGPKILAGCMGFMIICAWAFARPKAFKRPTIDVQLTENVDSQTEAIQVIETLEIETTRTTTIETEDTETTTSAEEPTTDTTETTTKTLEPTATSQPEVETASTTTDIEATSEPQGKYLTEPKTLGQIKFDINEVELSSPVKQTLNSLISEIKEYDSNRVTIKVEGHTSRVGDAQLNQTISQDRANVVVKYLKGQNLPYELVGQGMGYSQPLPESDPASDVNQRTVIILIPAN
ncbi:MAG: OmpA family protein [Trichodesmium sp. MAG_R03]|nr:OmpA family protein [Trichodesmium sp. MAG_R03]